MAESGGIQRYTTTLLRALKELLTVENVRCLPMAEAEREAPQHRLSTGAKLGFVSRAFWQALRWQPDLIICAHLALGPVGWLVSRISASPYWIVVYGIESWASLSLPKKMALQGAARVIGISKFTCERVKAIQRVRAHRLEVLPCAIDEGLTSVKPAIDGPHKLIGQGRPVVLTVGRMAANERYKGHDVVLNALTIILSRIPELVYVVVGEGDDRARIEVLADTLGVRKNVIFTGRVTDAELVALYNRSDVFVLPSRTVLAEREAKGEGFGIVYLEAMAFGKPVIGPDAGAPAEVIPHGRCGLLVNPEDSIAVAEALVELLTDPERARAMGLAGRDWVRTHYSYGSFGEGLKVILDGIAHAC